jgi:hypothetical protein
MTDPRDKLDAWLQGEVKPLAPPPGTFGRIRDQARRRRRRRAVLSAAGVLIVIAAAASAPPIASQLLHGQSGPPGQQVAAGRSAALVSPQPGGKGGSGGVADKSSRPIQQKSTSALSPSGSGNPVPQNFRPTSVTFTGPHVGAVIGQAGTPGHCATAYCTSLAGTSDYGSTWYGVSAPLTGPPDGASGVGQLRFLDNSNGWAFGPQLWVTHDGGAHWTRESTGGMRVTDLETAGTRAFALFATCTGTGQDYGANCTGFSLYTSLAGSNRWQPVPGAAAGLPAGSGPAAASLVLTGGPSGGRGYLLAPTGQLFSGPLTGGAWTVASQQEPCAPGTPGPSGQPTGALLTAVSSQLVMVCASATSAATDTQAKSVVESSDNGVNWSTAEQAPATGIATSLAAQNQGRQVVLATEAGLYLSGDGGSTWRLVQASPAHAAQGASGFSYIGMTSAADGVALPADPGLHEVFITTNGGATWQPQVISGA